MRFTTGAQPWRHLRHEGPALDGGTVRQTRLFAAFLSLVQMVQFRSLFRRLHVVDSANPKNRTFTGKIAVHILMSINQRRVPFGKQAALVCGVHVYGESERHQSAVPSTSQNRDTEN
jgi:hypothetical protein